MAPAKPLAGTYRMRVSWVANPTVFGEGGSFTFAAVAGSLKVTEPVLNETVEQGAVRQIRWEGIPATGNVLIQLKNALGIKTTIAASAPHNGSFPWKVPATLAKGEYTVAVTWLSDTTYTDRERRVHGGLAENCRDASERGCGGEGIAADDHVDQHAGRGEREDPALQGGGSHADEDRGERAQQRELPVGGAGQTAGGDLQDAGVLDLQPGGVRGGRRLHVCGGSRSAESDGAGPQ